MLRRIEIKDAVAEDWRGMFSAQARGDVGDILQTISIRHLAPWGKDIDLRRKPRFYFTEKAWREYAGAAYDELLLELGPDEVRVVEVEESHPLAASIDDDQAVVYTRNEEAA